MCAKVIIVKIKTIKTQKHANATALATRKGGCESNSQPNHTKDLNNGKELNALRPPTQDPH